MAVVHWCSPASDTRLPDAGQANQGSSPLPSGAAPAQDHLAMASPRERLRFRVSRKCSMAVPGNCVGMPAKPIVEILEPSARVCPRQVGHTRLGEARSGRRSLAMDVAMLAEPVHAPPSLRGSVYSSQAQPGGLWHSLSTEMQLSPHALPLRHTLQHASATGASNELDRGSLTALWASPANSANTRSTTLAMHRSGASQWLSIKSG